MMYIIFDTNVVIGNNDYFFNRGMRKLTSLNRFKEVQVCIPEVVKDEIIKKYRENIKGIKESYDKLLQKDKFINIIKGSELNRINIDEEYIKYKNDIIDILEKEKVMLLKYPSDGNYIRNIMERVTLGKKPFKNNKPSYRDAFIWYTILEFIKETNEDDTIVFITSNESDFFDSKKDDLDEDDKVELDEDFKVELNDSERKRIIVYKSMKSFFENNKDIKSMEELENIELKELMIKYLKENLKNKTFRDRILRLVKEKIDIENYISDYLSDINVYFDENLPYESNIMLDYISDDIEIRDIYYDKFNLKEGMINLTMLIDISCTKFFKDPGYDSSIDEPDEEFVYRYGNEGTMEMSINIYIEINDSMLDEINMDLEIEDVDIESIIKVRDVDVDYIEIESLN